MKIFIKIILFFLLFYSSAIANVVATITGIKGEAVVSRDTKETKLSLGSKLYQNDLIKTKDKTKVQIIFQDETIITIGKNSDFSINEYLFDDAKEPVAKFGLFKGAMRTITGKIGKISPDKFQVKTKTATMGIRGTRFTLLAPPAGPMQAFCSLGAIVIGIPLSGDSLGQESGSGHTPITLPQGSTVSVLPSGKFTKVQKFTAADLDKALKENFATPQKKKTTAKKTTQKTKKKKVAEKPNAKNNYR